MKERQNKKEKDTGVLQTRFVMGMGDMGKGSMIIENEICYKVYFNINKNNKYKL